MRILVAVFALAATIPTMGQSTTTATTNCNSTTNGNTTSTNCNSTGNTQPQNPGGLYGVTQAMKQAQANAQARRALELQEAALKQQKQSRDRDFELQAITTLEKDRETFAQLPATNDPAVTTSRNNLTATYNSVRTLACATDGGLVLPDIDGTPNSCKQMEDVKILQSVAGACEDYAAKHPDKADGHEIKAWGNRHFTCVKQADGTFLAKE